MGIKIDITLKDLKTLKDLLKQYLPYTLVWAFGSRVKFTAKTTSDLDLVAFISKEQELKFSLLKEAFEESSIPFRIDLHNWYELPETFHKNIESTFLVLQEDKKKELPSDWKTYKLRELGFFFGGVSTIKKEDYGHGTPFLPYKNVYKNSKVDINELELMNVRALDLERRSGIYGDIFFTASSETPDEVAMSSVLLDEVENLTYNGFCKRYRLNDFNTLIPEYARYLFRDISFRREVYQMATGDIRFNISQESLANIEIEIPDVPTQKQIAQILTSLDDKIELNLQMNQTLETMAQAIFKEWFVDFNFPKSSEHDLKDCKMGTIIDDNSKSKNPINQINLENPVQDNGLPKGWRMGSLSEILYVQNGYASKSKDFIDKGQNGILKIKNISNKVVDIVNMKFIPNEVAINIDKRFKVERGDLLIAMTGAEVGKVGMVPNTDKNLWLNQCVGSFKEKVKYSRWFGYLVLSTNEYQNILLSSASGSAQPNISGSQIERTEIILPSINLIEEFGSIVNSLFEKILENYSFNQSLTQTRDTLLPKLMNGQLELKK